MVMAGKRSPELLSSITAAPPQRCSVPPGWDSGRIMGVNCFPGGCLVTVCAILITEGRAGAASPRGNPFCFVQRAEQKEKTQTDFRFKQTPASEVSRVGCRRAWLLFNPISRPNPSLQPHLPSPQEQVPL